MPRLPFKLDHKSLAKAIDKKKAQIRVVTNQKPKPYDSTRTYMQLGTALKASELAQVSAMRVARMIAESKEAEELQEAALNERLRNLILEIDDFEKVLIKFQRGRTMRVASLATSALENIRASTGWFSRFLANHNEQDQQPLKKILAQLQKLTVELVDIRKKKVDDTVDMEAAFNEKRASAYRKAAAMQQRTIRHTYPEPAEEPVETLADPGALMEAARLEILEKEEGSELEEQK